MPTTKWTLGFALASALGCALGCGVSGAQDDDVEFSAAAIEECPSELSSHARAFGVQIGSFEHRNAETRFGGNLVNIDEARLQELGARWVRLEMRSDASNNAGMSMLDYYGDAITRLHDAGIRVLLLVDYLTVAGKPNVDRNEYKIACKLGDGSLGPLQDSPDGCRTDQWEVVIQKQVVSPDWAFYVPKFAAEVGEIAKQLHPDAWEIWNEPDTHHPWRWGLRDWDTHVPPQHYATMLKSTREAIRAARPTSVVVSGGVASGHVEYLKQVLAADPRAYEGFSGVGVHAYNGYWVPDKQSYMWMNKQRYAVESGLGLPIWLTEVGSTDTFDGKPFNDIGSTNAFINALYETVTKDPGSWGPAFYFSYSDEVGKQNEAYGLLHAADHPRKPQFFTYQSLAQREPFHACHVVTRD